MIRRLQLLAITVVPAACSVAPADRENLGTVSQAVNPTTFTADANDAQQNINDGTVVGKDVTTTFGVPGGSVPAANQGFCYLQTVEGRMGSPWASVDLYAGSDGYWHVKAVKHITYDVNGGPKAKWACHKFSDFTGLPSTSTALATRYDVTLTDNGASNAALDISGADKWCPLTGGSGDMDNAVEPTIVQRMSAIWQPSSTKTVLRAEWELGGQSARWGTAAAIRASTWCISFPGQSFSWSRGTTTALDFSGPSTSTQTLDLMAYSTCYLEAAGNQLLLGEKVYIAASPTRWALVMDPNKSGKAACIPYAQ